MEELSDRVVITQSMAWRTNWTPAQVIKLFMISQSSSSIIYRVTLSSMLQESLAKALQATTNHYSKKVGHFVNQKIEIPELTQLLRQIPIVGSRMRTANSNYRTTFGI